MPLARRVPWASLALALLGCRAPTTGGAPPAAAPDAAASAPASAPAPAPPGPSAPAPEAAASSGQWAPVPPPPVPQRSGLPRGVISLTMPASTAGFTLLIHSLAIDETRVYFNDSAGRIWGARKDGKELPFELLAGASEQVSNPPGGVHAIDLAAAGGEVFFTASDKGVMAIAKTGGEPRMVVEGRPIEIVSDGESLFFTPFDAAPLRSVARGGAKARALGPSMRMGGIAVDATSVYVAGTYHGTVLRIDKSKGTVKTLASGQPRPLGVAVDATHVYFSCESDGSVRRVPREGGAAQKVVAGPDSQEQIAVDESFLYWTSQRNNSTLFRARKDGSSPEAMLTGLQVPTGITVDASNIYISNKQPSELLIIPKTTLGARLPAEPPS